MEAGVLEVLVVLIGPEPGHVTIRLTLAKHAERRGPPVFDGVLPVLHAKSAPEDGMQVIGHVAGGEDALHVRPAELVHCHAVVELDARRAQPVDDWFHPQAEHGEVAVEALPVGGHHPLHAAGALEGGHAIIEEHPHPVIPMELL